MNQNHKYCYLIKEREFVKTGESIYRIGKSSFGYKHRIAKCPKNSVVFVIAKVYDCNISLKNIIKHFNKLFKKRTDLGKHCYQGDINSIIRAFNNVAYSKEPIADVVCKVNVNNAFLFEPADWARF